MSDVQDAGNNKYQTLIHFTKMFVVALCLGLLEAAWTTPSAPGATKAGMGNFAIGVTLFIVCYPRWWWLFGLCMLEEATQVFIGNDMAWRPNIDWVIHHWSAGYFGINLYPVATFPIITIIGEVIYLCWRRTQKDKQDT